MAGDIRLVDDAKTRAAIVAYVSTMESAWQDRATQLERMYRSNDLEFARMDAFGLPPAFFSKDGVYESRQLRIYVPLFVEAWPRLQKDAEFRSAQLLHLLAYSNIENYNSEMLDATSKIRLILEQDVD